MIRDTLTITFRFGPDLIARLTELAEQKDISRNAVTEGVLRVALRLPEPAPRNPFENQSFVHDIMGDTV